MCIIHSWGSMEQTYPDWKELVKISPNLVRPPSNHGFIIINRYKRGIDVLTVHMYQIHFAPLAMIEITAMHIYYKNGCCYISIF
mmetsp:Transcript_34018/g.49840  ORF Transcript_34018/g.49840 Transcript_34018/m.49840 type:complete len:84 (+) Transcript_34018:32-283(+)